MKTYKNMLIKKQDAIKLINVLSDRLLSDNEYIVLEDCPVFFLLFGEDDNK